MMVLLMQPAGALMLAASVVLFISWLVFMFVVDGVAGALMLV